MNFQQYIQQYQKKNLKIQRAKAELEQSKNQFFAYESRWTTTLNLEPSYSSTKTSVSTTTGSLTENELNLKTSVIQTFPTATTLTLSGTPSIDLNNNTTSTIGDYTYSATLTQPLLKNQFGKSDSYQEKMVAELYRSAQDLFLQTTIDQCVSGTKLYLRAYIQNEKDKILSDILKTAIVIKKSTDRLFKSKKIGQLDYYSAQSDVLETKKKVTLSQTEFFNTIEELKREIEVEDQILEIDTPPERLNQLDLLMKKSSFESNLEVRSLSAKLSSAEIETLKTKDDQSSSLDLSLTGARSNTLSQASTGTIRTNQTYFAVGLSFALPLFDPARGYSVEAARENEKVAESQLYQKQRDVSRMFTQEKNKLNQQAELLNLGKESKSIRQKQLKVALQKVKNGRIEFEDYIRFRDSTLQEELSYLDTKLEYWNTLLNLASMSGTLPTFCETQP